MVVVVVVAVSAAGLAALLAYGWWEAGWVRLRELPVVLPGLPPELHGVRIAHLSDFHLGLPSRGERAVERAVAWAAAAQPDLTVITGDLLSRKDGEPRLRELLELLPHCYVVLGNHDVAEARDPFSRGVAVAELRGATLLNDEAWAIRVRNQSVQIAGVHPATFLAGDGARSARATDQRSGLRILLCHFPEIVDQLPPGAFDLVLAGHMHDGQICIPTPFGKLRCAHPGARYTRGLYRRPGGTLHVSPGLGTTFVPIRFLARPEATLLVLQSPDAAAVAPPAAPAPPAVPAPPAAPAPPA